MSTGIIDIGSASVRMLLDGKRHVGMTKLAEGLDSAGKLSETAMKRTTSQIASFARTALKAGAGCVAFATEAVRAASNRLDFINMVFKKTGVKIEIISEFEEAEIAFFGACPDGNGTVIDIGGASVEIVSGANGELTYAKSLPLGAVRLTEKCKSLKGVKSYAAAQVIKYGDVKPESNLRGVGGTLTSLAAMVQGQKVYNASRVHDYVLTLKDIEKTGAELLALGTPEKILERFPSLQPMRSGIITAGTLLAGELLKYLKRDSIKISVLDNLDGYAVYKKIS